MGAITKGWAEMALLTLIRAIFGFKSRVRMRDSFRVRVGVKVRARVALVLSARVTRSVFASASLA